MPKLGPNHKDGCDGTTYTISGSGYNRVKVCECGAEDHAPSKESIKELFDAVPEILKQLEKDKEKPTD